MARLGLGSLWSCEFANDLSEMKAASYCLNFRDAERVFRRCDINKLTSKALPSEADLIWGSFPCQDLSLAGSGRGLDGARSGLIWKLLELIKQLQAEGRPPKVLVLENVVGLLNSRQGQDFYDILSALRQRGFVFGTLLMDAVHFVPHSRPRIFLIAVDYNQVTINPSLISKRLSSGYPWSSLRLEKLWRDAPFDLRDSWVWWNMPLPSPRSISLADLLEKNPNNWDLAPYTDRLLSMLSPLQEEKVARARRMGMEVVGALYRRTRAECGQRVQRVEIRFDGISGCLRTPSGGSSRQRLLFVKGSETRSRLLTSREAARLMGISDDYRLPESYNDAYQIAGDGVAVPVVRWLSEQILEPLLVEVCAGSVGKAKLRYA